ncbi:ABC-F type ribosomal protection protein [Sedimentibacter hydroxybenzoicus DSM 7310]|uniref:ABC-F type ribosomal protection protein n=1 Tax=Sedimentibacter hydroxybenzoicus DSM 7310 TaxID=1123245 RepID=A0A974BGA0_SEDHY|nr:ABC-F type ribosomal protection protein [Sedimentibacter hydroxybenzoicus]NYB72554.1 ABC-F type ribosomal protection protein [Sedimentibacter hydroxybenzoicus DSM 7310]
MIEIGISSLTKVYGTNKIFENVTFDVKTKDRIGLIGRNGTGKSTLLKIIAGYEDYQNGQVFMKKNLTIGYLSQIPNYEDNNTVLDVLNEAFENLHEIKKEMDKIEKTFDCLSGDELQAAIYKYSSLHDSYELSGGYNINEKINRILFGLEISESMQRMEFNKLSGGEKTKIVLGKILLEEPELLLLDEPSNHLDIKSVEWLEGYLSTYSGTIVAVSHDRYFLDRVVNKIVELESDGAQIYFGNYSKYVAEKELRFLQAMKDYENQQNKIKKMEEQIQRYRIWGEMRDSDKMYKRAKELEKRLEKIDKLDKPFIDKRTANFKIISVERTGKEVIKVSGIEKTYDKKLFSDVSFTLFFNDSMCILGENGTGKTTILKIILNEDEPDSGDVQIGSNVKIGYLSQEVNFENEDVSIVDYFSYYYGISLREARTELAKILFTGEDVFKRINTLSGGEKSRLKLGMLMYENVNTLILDEPTNHLDIESREVLEESLINYAGTLLFVSHDRYFVDKIATCIGELENKEFKLYNFDYEGYKQEKQRISERQQVEHAEIKKEKTVSQNKENMLRKKEEQKAKEKAKRDYIKLENSILETENKIIEFENILNLSSDECDLDTYNNIYNEYTLLKEEIDKMYSALEKLHTEIEG